MVEKNFLGKLFPISWKQLSFQNKLFSIKNEINS